LAAVRVDVAVMEAAAGMVAEAGEAAAGAAVRVVAVAGEVAAGAAVIRSNAAAIVAETPSWLKRRIPNPLVAPSVAPTVGERGSAGYRDLVRGWVGRPRCARFATGDGGRDDGRWAGEASESCVSARVRVRKRHGLGGKAWSREEVCRFPVQSALLWAGMSVALPSLKADRSNGSGRK